MMGAAIAALVFAACTDREAPAEQPMGTVIAIAYQKQLFEHELRKMLPNDLSPADSTAMAQGYINNWLRQQVILHKAEQNLSEEEKDVTARLENYRGSLLIHAYEQQLVEQKLNTAVHDTLLKRYMQEHQTDLELGHDIITVEWFKVRENNDPRWRKSEKWFRSKKEEDWRKVELWLAENHIHVQGNENTWVAVEELARSTGIASSRLDALAQRPGRHIEEVDDGRVFLRIFEHRKKGGAAPLEFVKDRVTSIIVNQRRVQLLEEMRTTLYKEALNNKHVEVL